MLIEGNIIYKKAIIVDSDMIKQLEKVILDYYISLSVIVDLKNEDRIIFDSVEDLIQYDNFSDKSISTLNFKFGIGDYIHFCPRNAFLLAYNSSVNASCKMVDIENYETFKRRILDVLNKHAQSPLYTIVSKNIGNAI